MADDHNDSNDSKPRYQQGLNLGTLLVVGMVFCTMAGFFIDRKLETSPYGTLVGIMLGLIYGAYEFWKELRGLTQSADKGDDEEK